MSNSIPAKLANVSEGFQGLKTRKKIHWKTRLWSKKAINDWDQQFPIGTPVIYAGKSSVTQSHAGMGRESEPVVFIKGVETPVALALIDVPGYVSVYGRQPPSRPPRFQSG